MTTQDKTKESTVDEAALFSNQTVLGDWEPKPLSIAGSLQLTRIVGWALAHTALTMKDMQLANIGKEQVMVILQSVEPDVVQEMFSIILQQDNEWVAAHWKLSKAIQCLIIFWEQEELGELFLAGASLAAKAMRTTGSAS